MAKNQQWSSQRLLGVGAALAGVALGVLVVHLDSETTNTAMLAAASPTLAQRCQTNARAGQINAPLATDAACMKACTDPKRPGKQNPQCICGKELGMADAGVTNCYNAGDCNPPSGLPECSSVEKPKGGEGGMPMLPMLPMPMPKPDMPMPPPDCTKKQGFATSTSSTTRSFDTPCPEDSDAPSGVSGFFSNLFGNNDSASSGGIQSTIKSAADRLTSFLSGGTESSAVVNTSASVNNPTEAKVTPVTPSGSNAAQLTAQGNVSAQGGSTGGVGPNSTVTGFGANASADVDTSTGPILSAMRSVISRIQSLLSSIF